LFTSDHGDLMGDHGLLLKGPFHYRGLIRVPFIWADPRAPGRKVCGGLSGTIDIAPTILARAEIAPYHGLQGRSLLPLIEGGAKNWRRALVVEEEQHAGVLGYDEPLRVRTYVTPRYRLTVYHGAEWGEIYDLEDDPHEQNNLWDSRNARDIRRELMEGLAYAQMALTDPSPLPVRLG
jgi:arylsulfatase A-like enzyme